MSRWHKRARVRRAQRRAHEPEPMPLSHAAGVDVVEVFGERYAIDLARLYGGGFTIAPEPEPEPARYRVPWWPPAMPWPRFVDIVRGPALGPDDWASVVWPHPWLLPRPDWSGVTAWKRTAC